MRRATIRFYAELCDLVGETSGEVVRAFEGGTAVGELIESCGVPAAVVDLVLVDGRSVPLTAPADDGMRISVFPVFEAFDIGPVTEVRDEPLRTVRFVADTGLDRLARHLRCVGLDTDFDPERNQRELVAVSVRERRILLTPDAELASHPSLTHGTYVPADDPLREAVEVVERFHLSELIRPFSRCLDCNVELDTMADGDRPDGPEGRRCPECGRDWTEAFDDPRFVRLVDEAMRA